MGVCQMAGPALYGVMVSWLYALYSFDYRWSISSKRLPERIAFFQQHWAFFLGEPQALMLSNGICALSSCTLRLLVSSPFINSLPQFSEIPGLVLSQLFSASIFPAFLSAEFKSCMPLSARLQGEFCASVTCCLDM